MEEEKSSKQSGVGVGTLVTAIIAFLLGSSALPRSYSRHTGSDSHRSGYSRPFKIKKQPGDDNRRPCGCHYRPDDLCVADLRDRQDCR